MVKKSPRRKGVKTSQGNQHPLSPPRTPPPLPPPLREEQGAEDNAAGRPKAKMPEEREDSWETCLRCGKHLGFRKEGESEEDNHGISEDLK